MKIHIALALVATVTASFSELWVEAKFNNSKADFAKTYATSEAEKPVFDGTTQQP